MSRRGGARWNGGIWRKRLCVWDVGEVIGRVFGVTDDICGGFRGSEGGVEVTDELGTSETTEELM